MDACRNGRPRRHQLRPAARLLDLRRQLSLRPSNERRSCGDQTQPTTTRAVPNAAFGRMRSRRARRGGLGRCAGRPARGTRGRSQARTFSPPRQHAAARTARVDQHGREPRRGAVAVRERLSRREARVFSELALLSAGEESPHLDVLRSRTSSADPAVDCWRFVKDNTDMTKDIGNQEQDAYFDMLIYANRTAAGGAGSRRPCTATDLVRTVVPASRQNYRGEIVHFDGKLKRLRQFPRRSRWPRRAACNTTTKATCTPTLAGERPGVLRLHGAAARPEAGRHLDTCRSASAATFSRSSATPPRTPRRRKRIASPRC